MPEKDDNFFSRISGNAIVDRLREHGYDVGAPAAIRSWLRLGESREAKAAENAVIRAIGRWQKSDATPLLQTLLIISGVTGLSLDALVLPHRRVAASQGSDVSREWLERFLPQCQKLSCYAVFEAASKFREWAEEGASLKDAPLPDRVKLAESWASELFLFAASERLKMEHGITHAKIAKSTLAMMVSARLAWIVAADQNYGGQLAEMARTEIYSKMFETIVGNKDTHEYRRYPTHNPIQDAVKSLRVAYDPIPAREGEAGWMIYYFWGPRLSETEIRAMVLSSPSQLIELAPTIEQIPRSEATTDEQQTHY